MTKIVAWHMYIFLEPLAFTPVRSIFVQEASTQLSQAQVKR